MDKVKQKKKWKVGKIIWAILFTFILSQLITAYFRWTIVDPILSKFGPHKISIEPYPYPQVHDGKTWILTEIRNDGLRTINNLNAEYYLKCEMDSYKKASLHKTTLEKGESDSFEFQANLDTNCSVGTVPYRLKFFKDKKTGQCYTNTSGELTSKVCMWCEFNVVVYDGFKEIDRLHYSYPFLPGGLTMGMTVDKGCQDITKAPNPENLVYEPEKDIKITIFDFCPGCIRGDIRDKEWCQKYCSGVYIK
jgi:hypothetical protein